ncbi:MAG: RtcB family protein [Deltaproteobacteria bacterium]|nr:RtcB family protein [Deltaproteobacteria bacterium]
MEALKIERIDPYRLKIFKTPPMRTWGIVYANKVIEAGLEKDEALKQVANVACLPGIIGPSIAMPDIHWGYGFPIGGVAAFSLQDGVISPGGVGYDINCGIRCICTGLSIEEILPIKEKLLGEVFHRVPAGLGARHKRFKLSQKELKEIMIKGALWAVKKGFGTYDDLEAHEDYGSIPGADPDMVSGRACERGLPEVGTLGSGNHFIEIDVVDKIMDKKIARMFSLFKDQILIQVHTGSRGFGHQICDDYIRIMLSAGSRYNIYLPDRQLACAPIDTKEAKSYLGAMAAAANFAFANREMITYLIRETFEDLFGKSWENLGLRLLYDCCHNIAKIESIPWKGKSIEACIHRKGATRALPSGDARLPLRFKDTGQPVLIPGDMGRASFILVAGDNAKETFFSACHGAGRLLSRREAKRRAKGRSVFDELSKKEIYAIAASKATLAEEMPESYKDVSDVVDTISGAGVAKVIAKLRPIGMIKG